MSARTARNARTARHTAGATYSAINIEVLSYFAILSPDTAILLSIGHETAADSTSVYVPAGVSFEVDFGITGSIQVKSTGADADCSVIYA